MNKPTLKQIKELEQLLDIGIFVEVDSTPSPSLPDEPIRINVSELFRPAIRFLTNETNSVPKTISVEPITGLSGRRLGYRIVRKV